MRKKGKAIRRKRREGNRRKEKVNKWKIVFWNVAGLYGLLY